MNNAIYETRLLRVLAMHKVRSLKFKRLMYDFFKVVNIDLSKSLKTSLATNLLNNDILIHTLEYEKKTHRIAREYYINHHISNATKEDLEIISTLLSIIIIQEQKNNIKNIEKYLSEVFHVNIKIDKESALEFARSNPENKKHLNDITRFIMDSIVDKLSTYAVTFTKKGQNREILSFDEEPNNIRHVKNHLIEKIIMSNLYHEYLRHDSNSSKTAELFEKARVAGTELFTEGDFSNDDMFVKLLQNTFSVIRQRIELAIEPYSKAISYKELNDSIMRDSLSLQEFFKNKRRYAQIKKANHFISFFFNCSVDNIGSQFILKDYFEAYTQGILFEFIIKTYLKNHNDMKEIINKSSKAADGLNFLNIDTTLIDSFLFIMNNIANVYYIRYVLIAQTLDVSYSKIKMYKERLADPRVFREDTFDKYSKHIHNAIHILKLIEKDTKVDFKI